MENIFRHFGGFYSYKRFDYNYNLYISIKSNHFFFDIISVIKFMNDNNPNNPTIILVLFLREVTLFILLFSCTEHVAPDGAELPPLSSVGRAFDCRF